MDIYRLDSFFELLFHLFSDYCFTYRRVSQASDLIGYDKHPQSVTKADFVSKVSKDG